MSEQIQGTIESLYTKDITIKRGARAGSTSPVYHAVINGHDVNLGFQTSLVEGQSVVLDVETKFGGYHLVEPGKGNVPSANGVAAASPSVASKNIKSTTSAPAFPLGTNTKDISIIRQSSLNRAVEVVTLMINAGLYVPDHADSLMEKVFQVAYQFTDFGSGQREVKQAAVIAAYNEDE